MSNPIRVLQVLAGMNRGGAETLVMNLYRNLDRTKVQFDFILFRKEECDYNEEIRKLGGNIYWIPRYNGKNHFRYKKAWRTFFKEHPEYRIIHGHVRSTASIYLKIAKKYNLSTIAHSHSTSSRGSIVEQIFKNAIQYPIRHTADYIFACSLDAGKWLFGVKALQKDNFKLIPNAIEIKDYKFDKALRKKIRTQMDVRDKCIIGHIGSFTPPKNHAFLLDVFKTIYDHNKDVAMLLIGDGELRPQIEKRIKELNLADAILLTGVRSDIPALLQAMDIFVFPSLFEGLGIAVIEAQASGLPCVLADSIPSEAHVTDLVETLSLNDSLKTWADTIIAHKGGSRRDSQQEIIKSGYDIAETAVILEEHYLAINIEDE